LKIPLKIKKRWIMTPYRKEIKEQKNKNFKKIKY